MAVFTYKAAQAGGIMRNGTVTADTPRQARDLLRARGLTIQSVRAEGAAGVLKRHPRWLQHRHSAEMVNVVRELATLLAVGVTMLQAFDTIARQHRGRFRAVLLLMRDRIASGTSLADAMREHSAIFDGLSVNIVEVGESAGTLETALERLVLFKERSQRLKNRVGSALIYPCLVSVVGVLVTLFLMTFVVPNLLATLEESGRPLPLATRVVQRVSDLVLGWWWLVGLLSVAGVLVAGAIGRTPRGRRAMDRAVLRLPLLGPMARKQAVVRIALVVSTLMKSGVVFVRALQVAQRSTRNVVLRDALVACEKAVYAGSEIAPALERTGAFPPLVVQVFAAGQQSGRLEEMLERLAEDYDQQVAAAAHRFTLVLEPVMMLALAVMVGFIAFATFMPILEAGNVL